MNRATLLRTLLIALVAVVTTTGAAAPAQTYDLRGGDGFLAEGARCTAGFAVAGGYVTAALCGTVGTTTTGVDQTPQGTVQGSAFPGDGSAWVRVNANWTPRGVVNSAGGTTTPVRGARPAPVGATACQFGSTSGWRCGTIVARNATVAFPEGILTGLIRTNICAEPGDLGAPLIADGQAQGILVAVSGNCASGGTSFYAPISVSLARYGLTLLTS